MGETLTAVDSLREAKPARKTLWRTIYPHRWKVLAVAAGICFYLGFTGFGEYYGRVPSVKPAAFYPLPLPDRVYATLSLFRDTTTLYLGKHGPYFPWRLEVARFAAPLVIVVAGLSALMALFSDQLRRLLIRFFYRRHLIICGLGQFGLRLAIAYDDIHKRVVVVDANPESLALSHCRERLIPVLTCDSTDPVVLRQAGVTRARHLVAVCGDDGINGQIGLTVRQIRKEPYRRTGLKCTVHIDDERVCKLLEESEIFQVGGGDEEETPREPPVRIHYLNVYRSGPLVLLRQFSDSFRVREEQAPHIILVGNDEVGLKLVIGAARAWWYDHRPEPDAVQHAPKFPVTLLAPDAMEHERSLRDQYRYLADACDLQSIPFDLSKADASSLPPLDRNGWKASTAFVTYPDERDSLEATMQLAECLPSHVEIVVVTTGETGTITPLLDAIRLDEKYRNVRTFPLLDAVVQPGFFDGDLVDDIAKARHDDYIKGQKMLGKYDPIANPKQLPWSQLDAETREANRAQANSFDHLLRARGYSVELTDEWDPPLPKFTKEEIEVMAEEEHERWRKFMKEWGWKLGPERDDDKRIRPDLISWKELKDLPEWEDLRETNRQFVTGTPAILARYGMAIVKRNSELTSAGSRPMESRPRAAKTDRSTAD